MDRIPILKIGDVLVVTVQVDLHDRAALALQDDLAAAVVARSARGVLIDISSLDTVDSFAGRMLGDITALCRMLGAETVVVGMQPAVAITIIELGLPLQGLTTALDAEAGMRTLQRLLRRRPYRERR